MKAKNLFIHFISAKSNMIRNLLERKSFQRLLLESFNEDLLTKYLFIHLISIKSNMIGNLLERNPPKIFFLKIFLDSFGEDFLIKN